MRVKKVLGVHIVFRHVLNHCNNPWCHDFLTNIHGDVMKWLVTISGCIAFGLDVFQKAVRKGGILMQLMRW